MYKCKNCFEREQCKDCFEKEQENLGDESLRVKKLRNPLLPVNAYFNEVKRTTTLVYVFSTDKRAYTAKASEDDCYDKELGFLVAHYHAMSKKTKSEVNEENKYLFSKSQEFLISYLLGVFCETTGMNLESAERFIFSMIKRAEKVSIKNEKKSVK